MAEAPPPPNVDSAPSMPGSPNKILMKMLERLFASLVSGPGLNCRPHSSRQRVDVAQLGRLQDLSPEEVLRRLLGTSFGRKAKLAGKAMRPKKENKGPAVELSEEERRIARQWTEQAGLLGKLRTIAEDARTYEQDTGVCVLNIGFPLLVMPPGAGGKRGGGLMSRRIVAPVAFIPVTLEVKAGASVGVEIGSRGDGVDLVRPNIALLSWLEQQTGVRTPELFDDKEAEEPWREIRELVKHVGKVLGVRAPELFEQGEMPEEFALSSAPRADEEVDEGGRILPAAVLGLFPMANEGLLRDTQAMVAESAKAGGGNGVLAGPVKSFLQVDVDLAGKVEEHPEALAGGAKEKSGRVFGEERLVTQADPCQSRAALMARKAAGLVIHGPPGTGKSQTITNIIGDHLARGQRVLMVCDKRTALDVVAHRLEHLGFGPLLALVHDPQRDQRDLYKKIREQLEGLGDVRTNARAAKELEKVDGELQALHNDLTAYWKSLMTGNGTEAGASFHELMGEWLAIGETGLSVEGGLQADVPLEDGRRHERLIREVLERGLTARYAENPWAGHAVLALREHLARPSDHVRTALAPCLEAARRAQIAVDTVIPALGEGDLEAQGALRLQVADTLEELLSLEQESVLRRWAKGEAGAMKKALGALESQRAFIEQFRTGGKLDGELWMVAKGGGALPTVGEITARIGKLNEYLEVGRKWYALICFRQKKLAREVLTPLGLPVRVEHAERAKAFLTGLRARLVVRGMLAELQGEAAGALPEDEALEAQVKAHAGAVGLLTKLKEDAGKALRKVVQGVFEDPSKGEPVVEALRASAARAAAVRQLEAAALQTGLLADGWVYGLGGRVRQSPEEGVMAIERLLATASSLEDVLRIRDALAEMPPHLATAVTGALQQSAEVEAGMAALRKGLLAAQISRRLREDPVLQTMDGQRLKSTFDRYRVLEAQKRELVREAALHLWGSRQKERLLAGTLTRASTLGSDLKRRLMLRGERAMRLRQVVEAGQKIEGGDPLFDMCPVWMASPETVAQVFPREALFDVVIFDEASQCRLEEALPVLTRGKRVVIAGDPKQLPPTRFFESTITTSDEEDLSADQDLFEHQQSEVEDLLTAALNLSIENAYLDVHYRSRNADLIAFSNQQFYNHRLQAIPGHPSNATRFCPLTLYRADGLYEERQNEKEAEVVCRIVRDLLKRAEPPSIGIACFNLMQRDLILEKLDELALQDTEFATRLAAARIRQGKGSFEGLFVKNLENVQGDERDHIIISTTYGPQKDGRFFQRFGPLARAGGGRRLNVLITRAREEVHLVTSIPAEIYRALPPVPQGQAPGGAWLLYAYLQYAERLAALYAAPTAEQPGHRAVPAAEAVVHERPLSAPSRFSEALAKQLAEKHGIGSQVHWGNDGFCVDVALSHPARPEDVTIGVLCDASRYLQAPDPVEWDLFRVAVHESQGWKLHRIWTPQFFRDTRQHVEGIAQKAKDHVASEKPKDALDVLPAREQHKPE